MNLLKAVLEAEVKPALGCTEPVAVALACSYARQAAGGIPQKIKITLDPGTLKNGMNVSIPGAEGEKGIKIAAALGAFCGRPELHLEVLQEVDENALVQAWDLVKHKKVKINCNFKKKNLFIEALVQTDQGKGRAIIRERHTNLTLWEAQGSSLEIPGQGCPGSALKESYKKKLKKTKLKDFLKWVKKMEKEDHLYLKKGIEMNLALAEAGLKLKKLAYHLRHLQEEGIWEDSLYSLVKIQTAAAADARMAGFPLPAMSSGGSGNQGIVAILVPYFTGKHFGCSEEVILESIALSHLLNSYIKCFTGELSPICHCAVGAGLGAAAALVYQKDPDLEKITFAINNIVNDLAGMFCNGANSGCAIKVVSSAESALSAGLTALQGYCVASSNGIIGATAEETIRNLGKISSQGMGKVDHLILEIMGKQG